MATIGSIPLTNRDLKVASQYVTNVMFLCLAISKVSAFKLFFFSFRFTMPETTILKDKYPKTNWIAANKVED